MGRCIPPLDAEIEYLSQSEAYERVKEGLDGDGLQLRFFEPGFGEWFEYYRENPNGEGLLYWRKGEAVQRRPERGDILGTIGRKAFTGEDSLKDISLVPMHRMPEWGDGSAHYSCTYCRAAVPKHDREWTADGPAHTTCAATADD